MTILEQIQASGHENILCTHTTTIEITKDTHLTKNGNCILGINASKACLDLNPKLKNYIQKGKKIKVSIIVNDLMDTFYGFGDKDLTLLDEDDMVFRKSDFKCDRTILINCTKSSNELNRELVENLNDPSKRFTMTFEIHESNERK